MHGIFIDEMLEVTINVTTRPVGPKTYATLGSDLVALEEHNSLSAVYRDAERSLMPHLHLLCSTDVTLPLLGNAGSLLLHLEPQ